MRSFWPVQVGSLPKGERCRLPPVFYFDGNESTFVMVYGRRVLLKKMPRWCFLFQMTKGELTPTLIRIFLSLAGLTNVYGSGNMYFRIFCSV